MLALEEAVYRIFQLILLPNVILHTGCTVHGQRLVHVAGVIVSGLFCASRQVPVDVGR